MTSQCDIAKRFWGCLLEDVAAQSPRTSRRGPDENPEGHGSDGRERGKLTEHGQHFFQHRYCTGLVEPFRQSDGYDWS